MSTKLKCLAVLDDIVFRKLDSNKGVFVAGGCFQQLLRGEDPYDIDVFFDSLTTLQKASKNFKNHPGAEVTSYNDWVENWAVDKYRVQFIKKHFYKNSKEVIEAFDFTVSAACYDGDTLRTHPEFMEDTLAKELRLTNSKVSNPASTLDRAFRFVKRGYHIGPDSVWKLVESINHSSWGDLFAHFYSMEGLEQ